MQKDTRKGVKYDTARSGAIKIFAENHNITTKTVRNMLKDGRLIYADGKIQDKDFSSSTRANKVRDYVDNYIDSKIEEIRREELSPYEVERVVSRVLSPLKQRANLASNKAGNSVTSATIGVQGTLPTASGGTGLTSIGTPGQVLTVNGDATALQWATPSLKENTWAAAANLQTGTAAVPSNRFRHIRWTVSAAATLTIDSRPYHQGDLIVLRVIYKGDSSSDINLTIRATHAGGGATSNITNYETISVSIEAKQKTIFLFRTSTSLCICNGG